MLHLPFRLLWLFALQLILISGCDLNRVCVRSEQRYMPVAYCCKFASGYCQATCYRTELQTFCVESVCKTGYVMNSDGKCVSLEQARTTSSPACEGGQRRQDGECTISDQGNFRETQSSRPPPSHPTEKKSTPLLLNEKIGFIDRKGHFISPPAYDSAREFSEGRAVVGKMTDGKWPSDTCWYQIIDKSGKAIRSEGCPHMSRFGNGLAPGSIKQQLGNVGYLDRNGHFVIPPRFLLGHEFHEGLASISIVNSKVPYLCGYIDPAGHEVIAPDKYMICGDFSGGLAFVAEKFGGKIGYIGRNGQLRIPLEFNDAGPFGDGLAYVSTGEKAGFINAEGQFVIKPTIILKQYTKYAPLFSEGLAAIFTSTTTVGFINKSGELVIPAIYSNAGVFREGLAPAAIKSPDGKYLWGYIHKNGSWAIKPQFSVATPFSEGVAAVGIVKSR